MQFIISQHKKNPTIDLRDLSQSEVMELARSILGLSDSLASQGYRLVLKSTPHTKQTLAEKRV